MDETETERRRARVLQLAYACSPWQGAAPGAGWHWAVEAAKYSDVWVICEGVEFRHQVLGHLQEVGEIEGLQFRFVRKNRLEQNLSKIPGGYHIAYRLWHRRALQAAAALHEEVHFDLVHQVNLCGYREPGKLGRMKLPFIWGPVGGTQNHPWMALGQAGLWGGIQETIRSIANNLRLRFSRRVHRAARRADLLLVANSTNQADFKQILGRRTPVLCEIGRPSLPADTDCRRAERTNADQPLRLLWVGNLEAFKALPLLLRAIAMLPDPSQVQLRVVGDGPQCKRWQRIASRLGVANRTEWIGRVRDVEMQEHYTWADLFVFTSLRDAADAAVLEALASGVPLLAADHQGVGDLVTAECGIKIPVGTPPEMSAQYRNVILALTTDGPRLERLSRGAVRRAADYAWPEQGRRMRDRYQQVLGDEFVWESRVASEQPDQRIPESSVSCRK